jgi:hypothetical protein
LSLNNSEACDLIVRFLAQDSFLLQSLAAGARRAAEFNADPFNATESPS